MNQKIDIEGYRKAAKSLIEYADSRVPGWDADGEFGYPRLRVTFPIPAQDLLALIERLEKAESNLRSLETAEAKRNAEDAAKTAKLVACMDRADQFFGKAFAEEVNKRAGGVNPKTQNPTVLLERALIDALGLPKNVTSLDVMVRPGQPATVAISYMDDVWAGDHVRLKELKGRFKVVPIDGEQA